MLISKPKDAAHIRDIFRWTLVFLSAIKEMYQNKLLDEAL
jgi:hypothetical protein